MVGVKWLALGLLVFQNGITPILFRYATTEVSADEKFSTPVAVTVQEFMKLIASMLLFLKEVNWQPDVWWQGLRTEVMENPLQTSKLAVPAALYFLQNQSLQIASAHLPAAVFQVVTPAFIFGLRARSERTVGLSGLCACMHGSVCAIYVCVLTKCNFST